MTVTAFLFDFCIMSALLFVAKIIRTYVPIFQRFYIPSALIAGFLGLFFGGQFLNLLPFSSAISDYPGVLIVLVFGSMYLGTKRQSSVGGMLKKVGDTFFVNGAAEIAEFGVFILIGVTLLPLLFPGINEAFGLMLPSGFAGGHGTAAAVGSVLTEAGWDEAASVGQTFATIGLLGGIILGVVVLNIGARRGYTRIVTNAADLPKEMMTGLNPKGKQLSLGNETINAISMDSLTWHLLLVLMSAGAGYLLNYFLKMAIPQISIPTYGLAILCGIVIQWILRGIKMDEYVDRTTVTHICGTATDYLVAFGIASIKISVVVKYAAPITILAILGFAGVLFWQFVICPRFLRTFWFERGLFIFGQCTGVLATGVLLLRVSDPEFRSGVLADFGIAWLFLSVVDALLIALSPSFIIGGMGVPYALCVIAISIAFLLISWAMFGIRKFNTAGGLETVEEQEK